MTEITSPRNNLEKKMLIVLLVMLVAIVLGLLTLFYIQKNSSEKIQPKVGSVKEAIYGLGSVKSDKVYEYKLGTAVTITKVFFHDGDFVEKGKKILEAYDVPPFLAPFSGVITFFPFHESENVFAQQTIARIEDLNTRYLEVSLEQQGALRVKKNQKVKLSFESFRSEVFDGEVDTIYPYNGQFLVRIKLDKLPQEILPGMTADVSIEVAEKDNVMLIPSRAVTNGTVVIIRAGEKIKKPIHLGSSDGQWIEVLDPKVIQPQDFILLPKE